MTWFKVDDSFHSHPKVLATEPAALGLWVVAGAWSMANLTDGFVPDHVLVRLLPGAAALAPKLVSARLWRKVRGGHKFHDWKQYQPLANDVRAVRERRAQAGRLGGLASGKTRSGRASESSVTDTRSDRDLSSTENNEINNGRGTDIHRRRESGTPGTTGVEQGEKRSKREANASAHASGLLEPPTRPDPPPPKGGGRGGARLATQGAASASPRGGRHALDDDPVPDWRSLPAVGQLSEEQLQLNRERAAETRAALSRQSSVPSWNTTTTGGMAVIGVGLPEEPSEAQNDQDSPPYTRAIGRAAVPVTNVVPLRPRTA